MPAAQLRLPGRAFGDETATTGVVAVNGAGHEPDHGHDHGSNGNGKARAASVKRENVAAALNGQGMSVSEKARQAKLKGYEGDPCPECGAWTLVRNGTCLKCNTCGSTTGCS